MSEIQPSRESRPNMCQLHHSTVMWTRVESWNDRSVVNILNLGPGVPGSVPMQLGQKLSQHPHLYVKWVRPTHRVTFSMGHGSIFANPPPYWLRYERSPGQMHVNCATSCRVNTEWNCGPVHLAWLSHRFSEYSFDNNNVFLIEQN